MRRRLAFLAFWFVLVFTLAWNPAINAAIYGQPPTLYAPYPGPYTPIGGRAVAPPTLPRGSALPVTEPTPPSEAGASVRGIASWYRWRTGEAAAGPALRRALGPDWRGSRVTICASRCIVVRLTDWCACPQRVIDLDSRSFALLAPLSRGLVTVIVAET